MTLLGAQEIVHRLDTFLGGVHDEGGRNLLYRRLRRRLREWDASSLLSSTEGSRATFAVRDVAELEAERPLEAVEVVDNEEEEEVSGLTDSSSTGNALAASNVVGISGSGNQGDGAVAELDVEEEEEEKEQDNDETTGGDRSSCETG